jgi:hypothetical protein
LEIGRGTVLEHPDIKVPVRDVLGLAVHFTRNLNYPGNADKTCSALKVLHNLYEIGVENRTINEKQKRQS